MWLLLIFIGSTDLLAAVQTSRIIGPLLRWLKPDLSAEAIAQVQFFTRKGAHVTEYAVLAALLWRAVRGSAPAAKMSLLFFTSWGICAVFAVSDEFHQSFVPSRTASPVDVIIDVCGALTGLLICLSAAARRRSVAEVSNQQSTISN